MSWKEIIKGEKLEYLPTIENGVGYNLYYWVMKYRNYAMHGEKRETWEQRHHTDRKWPSKEDVKKNKEEFERYVKAMTTGYKELEELMDKHGVHENIDPWKGLR